MSAPTGCGKKRVWHRPYIRLWTVLFQNVLFFISTSPLTPSIPPIRVSSKEKVPFVIHSSIPEKNHHSIIYVTWLHDFGAIKKGIFTSLIGFIDASLHYWYCSFPGRTSPVGTEGDSWEDISSLLLSRDFHHHTAVEKLHSGIVSDQVEKQKLRTSNLRFRNHLNTTFKQVYHSPIIEHSET